MNTQEETIAALQDRIRCLEANLHLALKILSDIEEDYLDDPSEVSHANSSRSDRHGNFDNSLTDGYQADSYSQGQTIEAIVTDKVALPTFLNSRTWKHQTSHPLMVKAS